MEHKSHSNKKPCLDYHESRGSDIYGNAKYDRYEEKEPYEMPYGRDSYGNTTYEDKDEYGNYKCDEEEQN